MKIIHIPFCYRPDPVGGTEIYVENLALSLEQLGVNIVIAAPGERDEKYTTGNQTVYRFGLSRWTGNLREIYGEGNATAATELGKILDQEKPDLVHLHAFTSGVSLLALREAKRRGIPAVFTYHTPTVSCQRGTLMRWGAEVCDGKLNVQACAGCALHGLGLNKTLSIMLGSLPTSIGRLVGMAGLSGGSWTALRMSELVELRQATFRSLMAEADRVVVLCQWTKELLLRNGVPIEKITVSRHGLAQVSADSHDEPASLPPTPPPLRIAYLGRLDPTKGVDDLIEAVRSLPGASLELHLYGIVQGAGGEAYSKRLKALASGDERISFLAPVPSERVISLLKSYHVLAVPSKWLETGPLVVLEAFAAGVPVIGSSLGGIAEWVEHQVNGLLVERNSVDDWSKAIRRLTEDPGLLTTLQRGISNPRSMRDVAKEMLDLYSTILRPAVGPEIQPARATG